MLLNCFIGFHPSYPASDSIKWKGAATQARGQSIAEDKVICFFLFYLPRISLNYGATTTIACVKNFFFFFLFYSGHRCSRGAGQCASGFLVSMAVKVDTVQVNCLRSSSPLVVWPGQQPVSVWAHRSTFILPVAANHNWLGLTGDWEVNYSVFLKLHFWAVGCERPNGDWTEQNLF